MNPTGRNGWIDTLRALSAVAVVLFHFNRLPVTVPPAGLGRVWHDIWIHGHWGVGVFFTLSGFCLYPGWNRSTGCRDFLRRRVGRIFPPYWCSLLLVIVIVLGVKLVKGVNDIAALPTSPGAALATVLLLTDPVTTIPTINWVYWTLSCLLAFYLLAGLTLFGPQAGRIQVLAALHVLLCLVDMVFPSGPNGPLFFLQHWPVFGMGMALAVLYQHPRSGAVMLLASALHAVWVIGPGIDNSHHEAVGCATVALLAFSRNRVFPVRLRPLAWIGKISYSLYLVHVPVGACLLLRFIPDRHHLSAAHIGAQLLLLAVTGAFAALFYLVAEKPFLPPPWTPPDPASKPA